jgi:hypothetical protein
MFSTPPYLLLFEICHNIKQTRALIIITYAAIYIDEITTGFAEWTKVDSRFIKPIYRLSIISHIDRLADLIRAHESYNFMCDWWHHFCCFCFCTYPQYLSFFFTFYQCYVSHSSFFVMYEFIELGHLTKARRLARINSHKF